MAAAFYAWRNLTPDARKKAIETLDNALVHQLQHEHNLPLDSPF
jgi:hypothetical protein